jgi:hypothetical protein
MGSGLHSDGQNVRRSLRRLNVSENRMGHVRYTEFQTLPMRFGGALGRAILGILFGMDHCHRHFEVFQRQLELVRIALLRFPTEHRLL